MPDIKPPNGDGNLNLSGASPEFRAGNEAAMERLKGDLKYYDKLEKDNQHFRKVLDDLRSKFNKGDYNTSEKMDEIQKIINRDDALDQDSLLAIINCDDIINRDDAIVDIINRDDIIGRDDLLTNIINHDDNRDFIIGRDDLMRVLGRDDIINRDDFIVNDIINRDDIYNKGQLVDSILNRDDILNTNELVSIINRDDITGMENLASVINRDDILNRDDIVSICDKYDILGRDDIIGRDDILGRDDIIGRDDFMTRILNRDDIIGRDDLVSSLIKEGLLDEQELNNLLTGGLLNDPTELMNIINRDDLANVINRDDIVGFDELMGTGDLWAQESIMGRDDIINRDDILGRDDVINRDDILNRDDNNIIRGLEELEEMPIQESELLQPSPSINWITVIISILVGLGIAFATPPIASKPITGIPFVPVSNEQPLIGNASSSSNAASVDRCEMFETMSINVIRLTPKCGEPMDFYVDIAGGVPGLDYSVDGDNRNWNYTPQFGYLRVNDCQNTSSSRGRLTCEMNVPADFYDTERTFFLNLNGCNQPVFEKKFQFPSNPCSSGSQAAEPANPPPVVPAQQLDRCEIFDDISMSIAQTAHVCGKPLLFYVKMPGGVPGLEYTVDGDYEAWDYSVQVKNIEITNCDIQSGYGERLYCEFNVPSEFYNSYKNFEVYLNGCRRPVFKERVGFPVQNPCLAIDQIASGSPDDTSPVPDSGCTPGEEVAMVDTECAANEYIWDDAYSKCYCP